MEMTDAIFYGALGRSDLIADIAHHEKVTIWMWVDSVRMDPGIYAGYHRCFWGLALYEWKKITGIMLLNKLLVCLKHMGNGYLNLAFSLVAVSLPFACISPISTLVKTKNIVILEIIFIRLLFIFVSDCHRKYSQIACAFEVLYGNISNVSH